MNISLLDGLARVPSGDRRHHAVCDFLFDEAAFLDDGDFDKWISLLAPDISYRMPVRARRLRADGPGFDTRMNHFDESFESLQIRVRRLTSSKSAFSEDPPSLTRRMVANVRVWETDRDLEFLTLSNLILTRTRATSVRPELLSAQRHDLLRDYDGRLKLCRRDVYLDQSVLITPNLGVFL